MSLRKARNIIFLFGSLNICWLVIVFWGPLFFKSDKSDLEFKNIMAQNKKDQVFLGFYPNMPKKIWDKNLKKQIKEGNLRDTKNGVRFILEYGDVRYLNLDLSDWHNKNFIQLSSSYESSDFTNLLVEMNQIKKFYEKKYTLEYRFNYPNDPLIWFLREDMESNKPDDAPFNFRNNVYRPTHYDSIVLRGSNKVVLIVGRHYGKYVRPKDLITIQYFTNRSFNDHLLEVKNNQERKLEEREKEREKRQKKRNERRKKTLENI